MNWRTFRCGAHTVIRQDDFDEATNLPNRTVNTLATRSGDRCEEMHPNFEIPIESDDMCWLMPQNLFNHFNELKLSKLFKIVQLMLSQKDGAHLFHSSFWNTFDSFLCLCNKLFRWRQDMFSGFHLELNKSWDKNERCDLISHVSDILHPMQGRLMECLSVVSFVVLSIYCIWSKHFISFEFKYFKIVFSKLV